MSTRTLKRKLKTYDLQKRRNDTPEEVIRQLIERETQGPGALRGYRSLWHHLRMSYGMNIKRDVVMQLLKEIDPEGNIQRRRNRLVRRRYISAGISTGMIN